MSKTVLAKGIDVSNVGQGKIADWSKVAKNVDFAILKISNGYQYDKNVADSQFATNFAACQKYGVPVGVYVFAYFTSVAKAKEAAQFAIKLLNGKKINFPIFLDLEYNEIRKLGNAEILELSKAFCEEVEKAGYQYGTYANKDWFANTLTDSWYDKYIKWVAQYDVSDVTYKGTLDIWQYTDKGSVPGINGNVDMNRCYTSFVKGDVNNDGKVTAADARLILRVSAKLEVLSGQAAKNADVDGDGDTDAGDARDALRISANLEGNNMSVKTYSLKKDGEKFLSAHFQVKEFKCKDGSDKILINTELIDILEKLFKHLNCKAINITSGYRTPTHSVKVGGYSTDQHTKGNAADITCKKQDGTLFSSNEICCALEDLAHMGGIGRINKTHSVHVDVRGKKCWFDETNGEKTTDSWYKYLGIKKPLMKGDVDGDGDKDAADARKILRISAGLENVSGQAADNADMNNDGNITAADAREALRKAAGLNE